MRALKARSLWIGDWLNYGEPVYGEKYSQALEATGIPLATLENYAYVAGNLQSSRRREDVRFSVHCEAVQLPTTKEQDRWLKRAADGGWTVAEFRSHRRLAKRRAHLASGDLPAGKFQVVYADPPWSYHNAGNILSSDACGPATSPSEGRAI